MGDIKLASKGHLGVRSNIFVANSTVISLLSAGGNQADKFY